VRDDVSSLTGRWVAAMRGVGSFLPAPLFLVDDPFGLRFAGRARALRESPAIGGAALATAPLWMRGPVLRSAVYMQIRMHVVDEGVAAFLRDGGRQVVLLGAGFDCRAWRMPELRGATVFEVDHPATQKDKWASMAGVPPVARTVRIAWDLERLPLSGLAARLAADGHDARAATLTVVEGVLMFLTPAALDATFAGIAGYSAPGSPLVMTYMDPQIFDPRSIAFLRRRILVRLMGEPFRSCFVPGEVGTWLTARGFELERDESATEVAVRLIGRDRTRAILGPRRATSHVVFARRRVTTG
jgi:methyltransferase (TIGR00027 family)